MPQDALVGSWIKSIHNLWAKRLRRASTLAEVLQVINTLIQQYLEVFLLFYPKRGSVH